MRIIRVRRGYTTNSSGGNEWVPPPPNVDGGSPSGQPADHGGLSWPADSNQVTIVANQNTKSATTRPARQDPGPGKGGANFGVMALLIGAVGLLFALTALVRRLLRRKR